jgi:hypothetical protein
VVEGAALEMLCRGNFTGGSNPPLSVLSQSLTIPLSGFGSAQPPRGIVRAIAVKILNPIAATIAANGIVAIQLSPIDRRVVV